MTGPQGLNPLNATRFLARLKPCPDEEKMPRFRVRATGTQAARKDPSLRLQLGPTLTKRGWGTPKTEAGPSPTSAKNAAGFGMTAQSCAGLKDPALRLNPTAPVSGCCGFCG